MNSENKSYDAVIGGQGAAAFAAGMYAARYQMSAIVIGTTFGGETATGGLIENYPGYPDIDGFELMMKFREHAEKYDVPIILNSCTQQDTYEGDFETRRALIWTLDFTMKGLIFGPVRKSGIIKGVNNRIFLANTTYTGNTQGIGSTDKTFTINTASTNTSINAVSIFTQPGLTANGTATSNASESVAVANIDADDAYGFITDYEEYFNANNSA